MSKKRLRWAWSLALVSSIHPAAPGAAPADLPRSAGATGNQYIIDRTYGRTPLMRAVRKGDTAGATSLLDHGAAVNARDKNGMTALMWAVSEAIPSCWRVALTSERPITADAPP